MRNRSKAQKQAKELVARMTMEERMSQLRYDAPAIERLGIPEYNWWNEALHGVARGGTATVFMQAIGLAAAFDSEMMQRIGDAVAEEGRAKYNLYRKSGDRGIYKGLTFWAPNVNIFRDPRWGRGHETYGEDPFLTGVLGTAFIRGMQGDGPYMKAAACAKHFAVHSGPESLRHSFDAKVSPKDMEETYLPAFEACVRDGEVEAVMGAYNRTNGEPCCGSKTLIQEILRGRWGFQGHFVSDCWAIRDFYMEHCVAESPEEAAQMALEAGCDVNCGVTYRFLEKAYEEGRISGEEITAAAERLFTTRYLLGMFEQTEYDNITFDRVDCREHRQLAAEAARKGTVLLKNNGVLPLEKDKITSVAVIGPNADSRTCLAGNYHGTAAQYITVLDGIYETVGEDVRVYYSQGCHLCDEKVEGLARPDDRIGEAAAAVRAGDVTVLCVGLDETLEGEEGDTGNTDGSGDKVDLQLPASQRRLMRAVFQAAREAGKPVIVCLLAGSAVDLSEADEYADAILLGWYPGARGGRTIAEILFGKEAPSGKLPVTFYRSLDGQPDFEDYGMKGRTYRYLEEEPLYPFGYGLTYGTIDVVSASIDAPDPEHTAVRVRVKNTGPCDAGEVVQVYVKDMESEGAVKNPSLWAFKRVALKQGEEQEIELAIPEKAYTVVQEDGSRRIESSCFKVYAGTSQPDGRSGILTGKKPVELTIRFTAKSV